MPDETRKIYALTSEEISELVQRCAESGIAAYQQSEKAREHSEAREHNHARRIKEKLASYRRVKKTIDEEREYTPQEQYEYRLKFLEDLMGDPITNKAERTEKYLLDREEKRRQDQFSIGQLETALELYREECEESGNEESNRRYRELRMLYFDTPAYSVDDIAALENVSSKTVYRDINIACEIMYQYVVGM